MDIGFIGTGNIGNPMARHMIEAGHALVVHDVREEATANLIELGATWADSPRAVAERCRVVFTSLPGPPEVESVVRDENGLLAAARPGDIHVDLSSNAVAAVRRLEAEERARGVVYIDCPVTGGVRGAEAGALTLLASGDADAVEKVRPVLEAISETIFYLGEAGTGCIVKLINNLIVLCSGQLMQEGIVLAAKAGVDPERLYEILQAGTARPHIGLMPYVIGRRFENPSFTLALATKDVSLALESARDLAVPMPVTAAAQQTYLRALAAGLGEKSFIATLEALETGAGVDVPQRHIDRGHDYL